MKKVCAPKIRRYRDVVLYCYETNMFQEVINVNYSLRTSNVVVGQQKRSSFLGSSERQ